MHPNEFTAGFVFPVKRFLFSAIVFVLANVLSYYLVSAFVKVFRLNLTDRYRTRFVLLLAFAFVLVGMALLVK